MTDSHHQKCFVVLTQFQCIPGTSVQSVWTFSDAERTEVSSAAAAPTSDVVLEAKLLRTRQYNYILVTMMSSHNKPCKMRLTIQNNSLCSFGQTIVFTIGRTINDRTQTVKELLLHNKNCITITITWQRLKYCYEQSSQTTALNNLITTFCNSFVWFTCLYLSFLLSFCLNLHSVWSFLWAWTEKLKLSWN